MIHSYLNPFPVSLFVECPFPDIKNTSISILEKTPLCQGNPLMNFQAFTTFYNSPFDCCADAESVTSPVTWRAERTELGSL